MKIIIAMLVLSACGKQVERVYYPIPVSYSVPGQVEQESEESEEGNSTQQQSQYQVEYITIPEIEITVKHRQKHKPGKE